jgi:glycosyltransferase involved in cell wall biosynthesis
MEKENIIYVLPLKSTFILADIKLLSQDFDVKESFFDIRNKKKVPLQFLKQFFFLIKNLRSSKGVICHFAGYSSFLPALFCKTFRKPCLIIVAGTDASKFSDFNYGNFTKKLLAYFTGKSLQLASHVLPVHESLHYQKYDYYEGGKPAQGYSYFFPKTKKTPFTPVYYGYDVNRFNILENEARTQKSFITIGNLADKYCFKRKGFDLILELAEKRPDCQFTFIGSDPNAKLETPKNLQILPFMSQDEIIIQLNKHQFYFQLSIMEGFPNALAEAMLCGCIPIGSNVSGIPYIIQENGFILKERNLDLLEILLDECLHLNEDELKIRSINSRKRIKNEFTLENRKNKIIKILEEKI